MNRRTVQLMDYVIHKIAFVGNALGSRDRLGKVFKIVDATFPDKGRAMTVATGNRVPGSDTIKDLPGNIENVIINKMRDILETGETRKRILVIDLSGFPYIVAMADFEEPSVSADTEVDKFSNDVYQMWHTHDPTKQVPVIMVNTELPFTGLKIANF